MNIRYGWLIGIVLVISQNALGKIVGAANMPAVSQIIINEAKFIDPNQVLIIFGVDMTLIQATHPATFYRNIAAYQTEYNEFMTKLSPEERDWCLTNITRLVPQILVEKETPNVIANLQQNGYQLIAFANTLSGSSNDSKHKIIFKLRDELQKLGINFTAGQWRNRVIVFHRNYRTNAPFPIYNQGYPVFYQGVLSANGDKGGVANVLDAFLYIIGMKKCDVYGVGYMPKFVIMIDANKKHLVECATMMQAYYSNIKFLGIEYNRAKSYDSPTISKNDFLDFWKNISSNKQ